MIVKLGPGILKWLKYIFELSVLLIIYCSPNIFLNHKTLNSFSEIFTLSYLSDTQLWNINKSYWISKTYKIICSLQEICKVGIYIITWTNISKVFLTCHCWNYIRGWCMFRQQFNTCINITLGYGLNNAHNYTDTTNPKGLDVAFKVLGKYNSFLQCIRGFYV